jgi:hypothetical protein
MICSEERNWAAGQMELDTYAFLVDFAPLDHSSVSSRAFCASKTFCFSAAASVF